MSTPVRSFRVSLVGNYEGKPIRGALQTPVNRNPKHSKGLRCHYTFRIRAQKMDIPYENQGSIMEILVEELFGG